jgi:hypothetical protein
MRFAPLGLYYDFEYAGTVIFVLKEELGTDYENVKMIGSFRPQFLF